MKSFHREWTIANTLGFFVGYLPYTLLAHGFTGSHGRSMNTSQLVAHGLAMAVVGSIVVASQNRVLRKYVRVPAWRAIVAVLAFIAAFWLGYFQEILTGPDWDIIFGFAVLGCAAWIGLVPVGVIRSTFAVLAFAIASLVGQLVAIGIAFALGIKPQPISMALHAFYFITVATISGLLGGALSSYLLARGLTQPLERRTAEQAT